MKHLLFILLISGFFCSCKEFLDLTPKNQIVVYSLEDVKTEMSSYLFTMACNSNYKIWYRDDRIVFPTDVANYSSLCMYSDNIDMTQFLTTYVTRGGYEQPYYENIKWEGASWASDFWYNSYVNIGFLNTILKDLSNAPEKDDEWRQRIGGEARIFRAYHAFKLLQLFAPYHDDKLGIPLNLDPDQIEGGERWSQTKVYRFLIDELTEVLGYEALPDEAWNVVYNKDLIRSFLSQVYWFKALSAAAESDDWQNAEKYSAEVMAKRDLIKTTDEYRILFTPSTSAAFVKNNPHALLMFAFSGNGYYREGIWGDIADGTDEVQYPAEDLMNLFTDPDDIRLNAFFSIYEDSGNDYQYIDKFRYGKNMDDVTVLFRIEDIYLINAEAKARQQDLSGAKVVLEDFRKAKIPGYTQFSGDVLEEILKERRKEFCFEGDQRWLDMKRLDLKVERLGKNKDGKIERYVLSADDYRYALPIPVESEIMYNPIEQNPGWTNIK